jgi:hypothetical protein
VNPAPGLIRFFPAWWPRNRGLPGGGSPAAGGLGNSRATVDMRKMKPAQAEGIISKSWSTAPVTISFENHTHTCARRHRRFWLWERGWRTVEQLVMEYFISSRVRLRRGRRPDGASVRSMLVGPPGLLPVNCRASERS